MEHLPENSTLTVPNDLFYLPAIQAFVSEVAEKAGLGKRDITMLLVALEEAIVNVVEHAFEPDEKATFQVIVMPGNSGITVVIKDKGLPYFPNLIPEYSAPSDIQDTVDSGLGLHLIKKSVDEIFFHNLGRDGKELHLVKYLPYRSIQDMNVASELERFPEPVKTQPTEKKDFSIRPIRLSEVYDVSKLFYRAYGYTYGIDTIYYPEKLAECEASGKIISVVTIGDNNRVVGHAALVRENPESKIAEAAMAVVEPSYRGCGCQNIMIKRLVEEGRKVGLAGIYSKAVTNHMYAQKAGLKAGFKRCAVAAGLIPGNRSYKGIHDTLSQRESVIFGYIPVDDPGNITVYPPSRHRAMIERTYQALGIDRTFVYDPGEKREIEKDIVDVKVTAIPGYNRAFIEVKQYGSQTVPQVQRALKTLCYQDIAEVLLYLNLEDPTVCDLIGQFEAMEFFYAGILPCSNAGGDALLLQYLNNVPIDYGKINIACEMGREILEYVRSCDPNNQ